MIQNTGRGAVNIGDTIDIYLYLTLIGILSSILSFLVVASTIFWLKQDLNRNIILFLAIGIALPMLPYTVSRISKTFENFLFPAGFLIIPVLLQSAIHSPLIAWMLIGGILAVGSFLLILSTRTRPRLFDYSLILAALAVLFCILQLSSSGYLSLVPYDQLIAGSAKRDSLFHASIASMIKNYGVISTGLDGLVPIKYHALSHKLMAGISQMTGSSVLETYPYAMSIVFTPVFMQTFLYAAFRTLGAAVGDAFFRNIALVSTLVFFAFLPNDSADRLGYWNSYLISETYNLALILLFAFFGFVAPYIFHKKEHTREPVITNTEITILSIISLLFVYFIGSAKISVMPAVFILTLFIFFRFRLLNNWRAWAWAAAATVLSAYFYLEYKGLAEATVIAFYPFRKYVPSARYFWPIVQAAPLIAYSILNFRSLKHIKSWENAIFFLLLTLFVVLLIPAMTMDIPGGAAFYFHNVFSWIAYLALLPSVSRIVVGNVTKKDGSRFLIVVLTLIGVYFANNSYHNFREVFQTYRGQSKFVFESQIAPARMQQVVDQLRIQQLSSKDSKTAIGITNSAQQILIEKYGQSNASFIATAVSETVSISNMPADGTDQNFGPSLYRSWTPKPEKRQDWERLAQSMGYSKLVLIE